VPPPSAKRTDFFQKAHKNTRKFIHTNSTISTCKWRKLHDKTPTETRPKSPAEALKCSSRQIFPAIHRILIILLTTPVGSVSCERSFSALRRLKLWTRASMDEERLSGLAMLLIHRGQKHIPSPEDIYGAKANWRVHDWHQSLQL